MKIAVLGAGAFGTALGGVLARNGYDIDYYDSKIERERLSDVLYKAKYIFLVIPSAVVPYLLPYLPKNIPLVVATKGILSDEVFSDFSDLMILSGPGFADDIKAKKETRLTVTDKRIPRLLQCEHLVFDYTSDKRGVLMCGALKNVYAILAGIKALKRGTKAHSLYIKKVLIEMKSILKINGADERTVDLFCGKDDLILTCGYPSRNYEFGDLVRKDPNYKPEKTVEGVSALERIKHHKIIVPEEAYLLKELMEVSEKWA